MQNQITWNWRQEFDSETISAGKTILSHSDLSLLTVSGLNASICRITGQMKGIDSLGALNVPRTYTTCLAYNTRNGIYRSREPDYSAGYTTDSLPRTTSTGVFYCSCPDARDGRPCKHEAALCLAFESRYPITFFESDDPNAGSRGSHPQILTDNAPQERIRTVREMRRRDPTLPLPQTIPLQDCFDASLIPEDTYFRMDRFLKDWTTTPGHLNSSRELTVLNRPVIQFDERGEQLLSLSFTSNGKHTSLSLGRRGWQKVSCNCGLCIVSNTKHKACSYLMAGFTTLWNYIITENPGDITDKTGQDLINRLTESNQGVPSGNSFLPLRLIPSIDWKHNMPRLRFSVEHPNGKTYIVRNLPDFTRAAASHRSYDLGRGVSADFSTCWFDEHSLPFYRILSSEYGTVQLANRLLNIRYSTEETGNDSSGIPLKGSILDAFYDAALGMSLDCDSHLFGPSQVSVGYHEVEIHISVEPIIEKNETVGVRAQGSMPVIIEGGIYRYLLDHSALSRMSMEDLNVIAPYSQMFGMKRTFECTIGRKYLSGFFYRTLEQFRQNPQVVLEDNITGRIEHILPPRGEYTYYLTLDADSKAFTCNVSVTYGDITLQLPVSGNPSGRIIRDPGLEALALNAAKTVFNRWSAAGKGFRDRSDDALFDIITTGIPEMEKYGTVVTSDDFPRLSVRTLPKLSFRLSIRSDLLNLSVSTRGLSSSELLSILEAYREKKPYVCMKTGEYIYLRQDTSFDSLDALLASMDITLEDAIMGKSHMPLFRALYVDQLLESHHELVISRDRTFLSLIKNFKTIRESDDDIPANLENILRPYQAYGFKWMRMLVRTGFGGILADDMGLGKTIQVLAVLASLKAEGECGPSLVVCPASLVFNWKEEASRFAPELSVTPVSGTQSARMALLETAAGPDAADLYISSYDIVRNDIALYQSVQFQCIILDEAQYVKNTRALMTKAIKTLRGRHRFALTGTPVENRLSDLWSIMDFLMPGFLYSASEFQKKFENPIMKDGNEELAARLAQMTGPFILRRLKKDVLTELPEKLEEICAAMMEDEQRLLYDAHVTQLRQLLRRSKEGKSESRKKEKNIQVLTEITRLRQICCDPSLVYEDYHGKSAKREMCMELIQSAIDSGHRMLIFSQFTSMLDLLQNDLTELNIPCYTITGSTPSEERLRLVNSFNRDNTPVFLISLRAGGTGLNLTGADMVIHYDPWWNLAVQNQATDRVHRIGQTRQVTEYRLVAANSIEEKILDLQNAKKELGETILNSDSETLMSLSTDDLIALLS